MHGIVIHFQQRRADTLQQYVRQGARIGQDFVSAVLSVSPIDLQLLHHRIQDALAHPYHAKLSPRNFVHADGVGLTQQISIRTRRRRLAEKQLQLVHCLAEHHNLPLCANETDNKSSGT